MTLIFIIPKPNQNFISWEWDIFQNLFIGSFLWKLTMLVPSQWTTEKVLVKKVQKILGIISTAFLVYLKYFLEDEKFQAWSLQTVEPILLNIENKRELHTIFIQTIFDRTVGKHPFQLKFFLSNSPNFCGLWETDFKSNKHHLY